MKLRLQDSTLQQCKNNIEGYYYIFAEFQKTTCKKHKNGVHCYLTLKAGSREDRKITPKKR